MMLGTVKRVDFIEHFRSQGMHDTRIRYLLSCFGWQRDRSEVPVADFLDYIDSACDGFNYPHDDFGWIDESVPDATLTLDEYYDDRCVKDSKDWKSGKDFTFDSGNSYNCHNFPGDVIHVRWGKCRPVSSRHFLLVVESIWLRDPVSGGWIDLCVRKDG